MTGQLLTEKLLMLDITDDLPIKRSPSVVSQGT